MEMDAAAPLVKKLSSSGEELLAAFSNPNFYFELLAVGISVALAWLLAILIRRRAGAHLVKHPLRRLDNEFVTKPLALLSPLLAMLYLSALTPAVTEHGGGKWIDAASQLCVAYFLAKLVLLMIRFRPVAYFIAGVIMIVSILQVSGFMKSVTELLAAMDFSVGNFKISMLGLAYGTVILVVVFWMAALSSRTLESYLRRSSSMSYSTRELTVKFFRLFVYFAALMIALSAMGVDLTAFAVFGGALGVGLGFGLQKITANFISGVILLMEKSIKLDDLIEVGGTLGWVRQLNVRYTLVETLDGRAILIPNDELLSARVTSWTYTDLQARIEILLNITYESNAEKALELMLSAALEQPQCLRHPEPTCVVAEFADIGMTLSLTFWIANVKEGRAKPKSDAMRSILKKFREHGIEIPAAPRYTKTAEAAHA